MRVVVTGGAGFIGSHTVEVLLEAGHEVWVVDDLSTGRRENVPAGARLVELDVARGGYAERPVGVPGYGPAGSLGASPAHMPDSGPSGVSGGVPGGRPGGLEALERFFMEVRPEGVVHLAAQSKVGVSLAEPDQDAMVNVVGTVNVLEAARRSGVRRVVYASSAAVYGDPGMLPITEDVPARPKSFYGASKYAAELYFPIYAALHGIGFAVLRYANVYGPRQDAALEGGVVAIFTDRLVGGRAPVIHGDGEQTRDFIYVRDVAAANRAALEASVNGVFNISTGTMVSVSRLFDILQRICWTGVEPYYSEPRAGDIRHSCLDNRRAMAAFGWKPRYSLEEGLKETVAWRRLCSSGELRG